MQDFAESFSLAFRLILSADADLAEIVLLSLKVSLSATLCACMIGMSLGAAIAIFRFPGRGLLLVLTNAMMGLPPVVVGLAIYMLLSNAGPFGTFQLLYSPTAMVIAQTVLVTPIATALTRQVIADLLTVALAGFGRAVAEVGAVIIVGGNINHVTRVMTTAIALETSKGDLALALALGIILIGISISVNAALMALKGTARRFAYE